MTKVEKRLVWITAGFFVLALFLFPGSDDALTIEPSYALPAAGEAASAEDDALILTLTTEIDLNHATAEELRALPGVGPVLSEAIVAYREEHGPFTSPVELLRVKGFGEAALEAIYAAAGTN